MSTLTDQIAADARDILCNQAEFGVLVKHTVRHGSMVWRKALVQHDPPTVDEDDVTGRRVVYRATFFVSVSSGEAFRAPAWGDVIETDGRDAKTYRVQPAESQRVGDVMLLVGLAYSDERFVAAGELRRKER